MEFTGVLVHITHLWSQTRYCVHFCLRDDNNKFFWFNHMFSAASTRLSWTTSFPAHIRSTEIMHVNVMAPGFMWVLGFELRFSCLHRRCFSHWTVSQPQIKIILSLRLFRIQQIQGSWIPYPPICLLKARDKTVHGRISFQEQKRRDISEGNINRKQSGPTILVE